MCEKGLVVNLKDNDLKIKIIIIICCIIVVITIGAYIYKNSNEENNEEFLLTEESNMQTEDIVDENNSTIMIHVTGEVENQGVVILPEGARIVDAIEAAGGETVNADLNKLNLAYVLSDGEKLYVPNKNEENENTEYITTSGGENSMDSNNGLINLNTASIQELTTLPGIGEALATRIIEYREQNGKFNDVEDIKNVSGIGDSKYESIKDLICTK